MVPLNSKRLTITYLCKITQAMELPVSVSGEQFRQLIEGKIIGMGKEPRNVQVLIKEVESGDEHLFLQDKKACLWIPPQSVET